MRALFGPLLFALAVGCDKKTSPPGTGLPASAAPAASAGAKRAEQPWFVGTWSATYTARAREVQSPKEGYVKEWRDVDAGDFTGPGTVTLQIDGSGRITGSAEGALGSLSATGEVNDDSLRVTLQPKAADAAQITSAYLIAARDGDGAKGTLSASTGDSLRVRQADIALARTSPSGGQ